MQPNKEEKIGREEHTNHMGHTSACAKGKNENTDDTNSDINSPNNIDAENDPSIDSGYFTS